MGVLSCFLLFHYCACKWRTPRIPREFSSSVSFIRSPSAPKTSQHPTHHGQGTTAQPPVAKDPLHLLLSQPFPATSALAAAAPLNPSTSAWLRGTTAKQPNKPKQLVLIRTLACFDNALNLHVGTAGVFFFFRKMCASLQHSATKSPLLFVERVFPGYPLSNGFQVPRSCLLSGLEMLSHGARGAPKVCHGHIPRFPRCPQNVQGHGGIPILLPLCSLPWLSRAPSPVTGSSKIHRVQRHFMLTERFFFFSARNLRLNKLESSLRRKQKTEGEELALSCTAQSWCTLENSQVRCTSNPHLATFPCGFVGNTVDSSVLVPQLPACCTLQKSPEMLSSLLSQGNVEDGIYSGFTFFFFFYFYP